MRILVVEDEPLVAFDTEHFLIGEGFQIVGTVDSVASALGALDEDDAIDLLLVDAQLRSGAVAQAQQALELRRAHDPMGVPLNRQLAIAYRALGLPDQARAAERRVRERLGA